MKKRINSFFGVHFDFHAMPGQTVGEDCRPEVIADFLDRVKPDYVQCDTKGHPGLSSYPTKAGTQADVILKDVLKMWRDLTKERDIALFGHHSGLFDQKAASLHPDWAVKDENGNISDSFMSPFSPYADEILIPQLKELAIDYDLNGAWVDGDCWATYVDYSEYAVKAYREEHKKEPPKSADEDYEKYREFCRNGFLSYVAHYIEEIKKIKPGFEITSNWIYSPYMPEKTTVKPDFLSGDYASTNSVETARHASRCVAARNIPWDLMAWGQNAIPGSFTTSNRSTKEYEQYCQEAAVVISIGGGFEFFNIMYGGGGTIQPWAVPLWEKVAAFCREREFCHKSEFVHQVGIIYPFERNCREDANLYSNELDCYTALCSWNNCMLNCGFSTEVVFESEPGNLNDYPVIVLPTAKSLSAESVKLFEKYVENGGRLIVDLGSAEYFSSFAGITKSETNKKLIFIEGNNALAAAETDFASFSGEFNVSGYGYNTNYFTGEKFPVAIKKNIGKGSIVFMCINLADTYKINVTTAIKDFMRNVIKATDFEPVAEISGSSFADLSIMQKDGKLILSVVNTAGQSGLENVRGYNEVPKIGPITVKVKADNIKRIIKMPENENIEFSYKNGYAEFNLGIVHIHTAAVIEF